MSLAHAQGLRDTLLKLRDTYSPPTAEEVRLFSTALSTDETLQTEPEPIRLRVNMPVPLPDFKPQPKQVPLVSVQAAIKKRLPLLDYTAEEVETRW